MNLIHKEEILFIKEQYEKILKEERDIQNKKRYLQNILLILCR